MNDKPLILLGAGGHAKVLLSLALAAGKRVAGVCDPDLSKQGSVDWRGIKVLGDDTVLDTIDCNSVQLINGVGHLAGSSMRLEIHRRFKGKGFHFASLVHPLAWVDRSAKLGEGAQVMAGAIVQADTILGNGCIVNTKASVDHDCTIGDHAHIAPGATVCGTVTLGVGTFIGSGATVIQNLSVGDGAVVAAGAVVVRDLSAGQTLIPRQAFR